MKKYFLLATTAMVAGLTGNAVADDAYHATMGVMANIETACSIDSNIIGLNFGDIYVDGLTGGGAVTLGATAGGTTITTQGNIVDISGDGYPGELSTSCAVANIAFDGCVDSGGDVGDTGCAITGTNHRLKNITKGSYNDHIGFGGTLVLGAGTTSEETEGKYADIADDSVFKVKVAY